MKPIAVPGGKTTPVIDSEGWLEGAERRASTHWDERPQGTVIDLLVVHNISLPPGDFGGPWIDDLFFGRLDPKAHPYFEVACAAGPVSTHLLVRRNGRLLQYVPMERRAWHAGRSCFDGRERCNDFSIGIELEGTDTDPFENCQYDALVGVVKALCRQYPSITMQRIAGHSDIAPGRKTDPGSGFDWNRLSTLLA